MATIRESITLDPISAERLDTMGNIHRYNFGWVKTQKIVGDGEASGEVVDSSVTGISGISTTFTETVGQEILPPSLETPDVSPNTEMNSAVSINSFFKHGTKKRAMVRARAVGMSELIIIGTQQYSIKETKEYADAMGAGSSYEPDEPENEAAEGGMIITIANGVSTKTLIKG